jgi:HEAT repeat protein
MKRLAVATVALVVLAGCSSRRTLDGFVSGLLGAPNAPADQLIAIRDAHEPVGLTLRADAPDALETTRTAVRELSTCDYSTWSETALVVETLSWMADEHPSSLVRAECLDTLTRMAPWITAAVVPVAQTASWDEVVASKKALDAAGTGSAAMDSEALSRVEHAIDVLARHPYDRIDAPVGELAANSVAGRAYGENLRAARGAMRSIGPSRTALDAYRADPGVANALDRALVALSATTARLTLMKAALADPAERTRVAALRDIAQLAPAGGAPVLGRVLLYDGYASVRREAARALASYPLPVAIPPLLDGLSDEMTDVRQAAARSLADLTGERFGGDRRAWTRWWSGRTGGVGGKGPAETQAASGQ